jgi:hypothetical protein
MIYVLKDSEGKEKKFTSASFEELCNSLKSVGNYDFKFCSQETLLIEGLELNCVFNYANINGKNTYLYTDYFFYPNEFKSKGWVGKSSVSSPFEISKLIARNSPKNSELYTEEYFNARTENFKTFLEKEQQKKDEEEDFYSRIKSFKEDLSDLLEKYKLRIKCELDNEYEGCYVGDLMLQDIDGLRVSILSGINDDEFLYI